MEKYKLDVMSKTLTITKAFEDAMNAGKGKEYALYTKLMRDIPGLTVVRKTHSTPSGYKTKSGEKFRCNQFKNLKYENMERFMSALPNSELYFAEYNFIRKFAAAIQTNGYALVRKWFMEQFPEFRKNPLLYIQRTPEIVKAADIIELRGEAM